MNRRLTFALSILLLGGFFSGNDARAAKAPEPRGGRVGWARLVTPDPQWNRHTRSDEVLSNFIRKQTSLNIDPTWYSANPNSAEQLGQYPLIFTNDIAAVKNPAHLDHLREYLQRGGFLLIDACCNTTINPDPDEFLKRHTALLGRLLPASQVRMLPPNHEVYRSLFTMRQTPPHVFMQNRPNPKWSRHGLYGVFEGERMVALISLSGLQCGWDNMSTRGDAEECMRMIVNIYVYTMTRSVESDPKR